MKIGILGGGQLGRMLLQVAANYNVETFVLENDKDCPASKLCTHFHLGNISNYEDVYRFGKLVDALTIEIEHVNIEALLDLEKEGLKIYPSPKTLAIIKDKGLQKQFYREHKIPTSDFIIIKNKSEIGLSNFNFPFIQKTCSGGYDGKGVQILKSENDFNVAFDAPSVIEKLVDIEKELSVMVAKNVLGEITTFPITEMVFDPVYNLVNYLISPADISVEIEKKATEIALKVVEKFDSAGLFAVELFLDKEGNVLVNEIAPRAHNSGHQTIEGNFCSQFDMQMRILQNLPLGNTEIIQPSLMLNLVGETTGKYVLKNLPEILRTKGVYVHLYGKAVSKPGRKMGHITILEKDKSALIEKYKHLKYFI